MISYPTEAQECEVFHQWLNMQGLPHHHCANESQSGRKDAIIRNARNKRMGQSKGFPDYLVIIPDEYKEQYSVVDEPPVGVDCGLVCFSNRLVAIEMKRKKGGRLSPEQKQWLEWLESAGIEVFVAKGADEAIRWIEERLK